MKTKENLSVDVYGVPEKEAKRLLKKYAAEIIETETKLFSKNFKITLEDGVQAKNTAAQKALEDAVQKRKLIIEKIKQENGYLFVDLQTVMYPDDNTHFTTIEIIDKSAPNRLKWIDSPTLVSTTKNSAEHPPDLIDQMNEYSNKVMMMVFSHQVNIKPEPCPVYHCVLGFGHPELKPYLTLFNRGAVEQRGLILQTLKRDASFERRAAAVFLVGHFQDPHDIIAQLMPYIVDKNSTVRNNAMRVLATTLGKMKDKKIDLLPFIRTLDSPYVTDRNKALAVILTAAHDNFSKKMVLEQAGSKLLVLLRMRQPNNHDLAYLILKKISKRTYSDKDFKAWHDWVIRGSLLA